MELTGPTIGHLQSIFSVSLLTAAAWLFAGFLAADWRPKASRSGREEHMIEIARNGIPFEKIRVNKNRYSIGRDQKCDIRLAGSEMPLWLGVLSCRGGLWELHRRSGSQHIASAGTEEPVPFPLREPYRYGPYTIVIS